MGEWEELGTDDMTAIYHKAPSDHLQRGRLLLQCTGRANVVAPVRRALFQGLSIHQGSMLEIALTSPTTARGIGAMFDCLHLLIIFTRYGHYEEEYVKEASGWKIKSIVLTRRHWDM